MRAVTALLVCTAVLSLCAVPSLAASSYKRVRGGPKSAEEVLESLDQDLGKATTLKKETILAANEAQMELEALKRQVNAVWCKARNRSVGAIKKVERTFQVGLHLEDVDPCFKPEPPRKEPINAAVLEDEPIYEMKRPSKDATSDQGETGEEDKKSEASANADDRDD